MDAKWYDTIMMCSALCRCNVMFIVGYECDVMYDPSIWCKCNVYSMWGMIMDYDYEMMWT